MYLFEFDHDHLLDSEGRRRFAARAAEIPQVVAVWLSLEDDGTEHGHERLQFAVNRASLKVAVDTAVLPVSGLLRAEGILVNGGPYLFVEQYVIPEEIAKALNVPFVPDRKVRVLEMCKEPAGSYSWSPAPCKVEDLPQFHLGDNS